MLKGVLTLLLLQLIGEQEDYGYSVVVRLRAEGFTDLAEGTVYPALSRLESNGLLSSRLEKSTSGPARKYYALTPEGRAALTTSLAAWNRLVGSVARVIDPRSPS
jgi:PadR family transcriptional regulator, regulatory protein PadR